MPNDEVRNELFEKWREMVDATLSTEQFLASHLHELDYGRENDIFKKLYEHLSDLRDSPAWHGFWRAFNSLPSSNWQIVLPLSQLVPNQDEVVWFLVDLPGLSLWPVFEGSVDTVEKVVNQCRLVEYYVIAKDLRWVIAKSRHDELFANGETVENNVMNWKDSARKPEQ